MPHPRCSPKVTEITNVTVTIVIFVDFGAATCFPNPISRLDPMSLSGETSRSKSSVTLFSKGL